MKRYYFIFTLLLFISCSRFKVDKLDSELIFSIPISESHSSVYYPKQFGIYHGIPSKVGISGDWLILSEPSEKKVKIFKDNELQTIIISENTTAKARDSEDPGKTKVISNNHLEIPGIIVAGNDDDFYVVSYTPSDLRVKPQRSKRKIEPVQTESTGFYKILHFDMKGNFLHLIGRRGLAELPFESIIWMDTDSDNRIWVLHRHLGELFLEEFANGKEIAMMNQKDCEKKLFKNANDTSDVSFISKCEYMYPSENGEDLILIGKVGKAPSKNEGDGYTFLYRKYVVMERASGKSTVIFNKLNDPEDYPYIPYEDNIFIWRTVDPGVVRFGIYTQAGDLVKSLQVELFGKKSNWRSLYASLSGNIYGVRVFNKNIEIYQWQ